MCQLDTYFNKLFSRKLLLKAGLNLFTKYGWVQRAMTSIFFWYCRKLSAHGKAPLKRRTRKQYTIYCFGLLTILSIFIVLGYVIFSAKAKNLLYSLNTYYHSHLPFSQKAEIWKISNRVFFLWSNFISEEFMLNC